MNKQEVQQMRGKMTDAVAMKQLYQSDPSFRSVVDSVESSMPSMTAVQRAKMPTYLINRHYFGSYYPDGNKPTARTQNSMIRANAQQERFIQEGKMQGGGLLTPSSVEDPSLAGFAGNVVKSGARFAGDVGNAVMNPIETAKGLGKAALGGLINTAETVTGNEDLFDNPLGSEDVASSIGQMYVERYGGMDNLKKTAYEDPIGFIADITAVVGGGGAAVSAAGKAGKVSSVAKAGSAVSKVANTLDPALMMGRAAKGAIKAPANLSEKLVSSSLKLKASDAAKIAKKNVAGVDAEKWLLDNKIVGVLGDSPEGLVTKLEKSSKQSKALVDQGLSGIREMYDITAKKGQAPAFRVGQAIDVVLDKYGDLPGLEDDVARLSQLRQKRMLNLTEINEVKRILDDADVIFKTTGDVKDAAAAKGLATVRNDIKTFIEQQAAKNGFPEVQTLNKNTQVARKIADAIADAESRRGGNRLLSLTDLITGVGFGAAIDPVTGAAIVVLKKILESPRLKTASARLIQSLGPDQVRLIDNAIRTKVFTPEALQLLRSIADEAEKAAAPAVETMILPERAE